MTSGWKKFQNKRTKKIIGGLIIGGLSTGALFSPLVGNIVSAENNTPVSTENFQKSLSEKQEWLNIASQFSSFLVRPLVTLAGLAMDNSLVYGAAFGLDAPLFKFWNMIKNIANFALAFIFLYLILKAMIGGKGGTNMMDVIKKTLIAGILIQASRFLMSAAIDISTIATYSVGGLPMSILQNETISENSDTNLNKKILGTETIINLSNEEDDIIINVKTAGSGESKKIADCKIRRDKETETEYIIGRERAGYKPSKDQTIPTEKGLCYYMGGIYAYNEPNFGTETDLNKFKQNLNKFEQTLSSQETTTGDKQSLSQCGIIIPIRGKNAYATGRTTEKGCKPGEGETGSALQLDSIKTIQGTENIIGTTGGDSRIEKNATLTIGNILKKSKSYVGVMATLYGSLLNFSDLTDSAKISSTTQIGGFFKMLINVAFALALILPLAALVIVLIARIGILRIVIAFIPIIILLATLGKNIGIKENALGDHFSVGNIFKLLLAPVLITAAVSLCMVFVTLIRDGLEPKSFTSNQEAFQEITNGEYKDGALSFMGILKIQGNEILDHLGRIISMVISIAIVRFILFRAIKQNKIGEKVGGSIQNMAQKFLGEMPIIPIAGGVGFNQINPNQPNSLLNPETTLGHMSNQMKQDNLDKLAMATEGSVLAGIYGTERERITGRENEIRNNILDYGNNTQDFISRIKTNSYSDATFSATDKKTNRVIEVSAKDLTKNIASLVPIFKEFNEKFDTLGQHEKEFINEHYNKNLKTVKTKKELDTMMEYTKLFEAFMQQNPTQIRKIGDHTYEPELKDGTYTLHEEHNHE